MKLLFDANLSFKLARNLADLFPGSMHVADLRLRKADDDEIREAARREQFAIVTKDSDFPDISIVRGHPPKIVWIRVGNCSTGQVESLIRWRADALRAFLDDADVAVLALT